MFSPVFDVAKAALGLMIAVATIVAIVSMGALFGIAAVWAVIKFFQWLF